jgi:hypothetical protein
MLYKTAALALVQISSVWALPIRPLRREVPQEHSHEPFLTSVRTSLALNNPDGIVDPVFGLLGDAAAAAGLGKITDPDCLQQATADQAFTNAKAAGDVQGQVDALIYRALERNTGKVGLASVACTSIKAVNPEIAAISQHQDPASTGAAATNKAIVLTLAQQIAAVGGDPQDALKSGTFAPGSLTDTTGKGNTCDVATDLNGCIFTQNLLVEDATAAEISAAVGGAAAGNQADTASTTAVAAADTATTTAAAAAAADAATTSAAAAATKTKNGKGGKGAAASAAVDAASACPAAVTVTVTAAAAAATTAVATNEAVATSNAATATASATSGANLQTFTGALGGAAAPAVVAGGRGFLVDGSSFLNIAAALGRSCDVQHNACANVANSAAGQASGLTVGQCDTQDTACKAA